MSEVTPEEMVEDIYYEVEDADVIPIPIDPTLSNPGEAADAKATGDAIRAMEQTLNVNGVHADNEGTIHLYPANIPMSAETGAGTLSQTLEEIGGRSGDEIMISKQSTKTISEVINEIDTDSITNEQIDQMMGGWDNGDT